MKSNLALMRSAIDRLRQSELCAANPRPIREARYLLEIITENAGPFRDLIVTIERDLPDCTVGREDELIRALAILRAVEEVGCGD